MPTPDFTQDNTAPVAVTLPTHTQTGDAPAGVTGPSTTPDNTAPAAVAGAVPALTDAAPSLHAIGIGAPTDDAPVPLAYVPPTPADLSDENMHLAPFIQTGKLAVDQVFGFYVAPTAALVLGVQLAAQVKPTGSAVEIELVNAAGDTYGKTATLPADDFTEVVNFDPPLALVVGAVVRAKVSEVGSGVAGSYLTANLLVQLTPA